MMEPVAWMVYPEEIRMESEEYLSNEEVQFLPFTKLIRAIKSPTTYAIHLVSAV